MTELISGETSVVRVKVENRERDDIIGGHQNSSAVLLENNRNNHHVSGGPTNKNADDRDRVVLSSSSLPIPVNHHNDNECQGGGRTPTTTSPNCGQRSPTMAISTIVSTTTPVHSGSSSTYNHTNTKSKELKNLKVDLSTVDGFTNCFREAGKKSTATSNAKDGGQIVRGGQSSAANDLCALASKEELIMMCNQLQEYIMAMQNQHQDELNQVKESEEKIRVQQLEASRRESVLVMRLTTKEQEMQEYAAQLNELKASMIPNSGALRSTLLDPAVNFLIQKLRTELEETKKKLEDTQSDLNAWKFTPDSHTGKRLMAKCRMLHHENEELGKIVSSGRLAKLESDLALQKSLTVEMKKSQSELDELVQELDEDVEGMQSTILLLQQQLRNKVSAVGSGNDETRCSALDSLVEKNNSPLGNCTDRDPSSVEIVQIKLADLCAQCRTKQERDGQKNLTLANSTTPATNDVRRSDKSDSNSPHVADFERTCVNKEADASHSLSTSTSNQSVQNVVNLNAKECDATDGGPPSKRTKLHGETAVLLNDIDSSSQTVGSSGRSTSSFNGNGSVEY